MKNQNDVKCSRFNCTHNKKSFCCAKCKDRKKGSNPCENDPKICGQSTDKGTGRYLIRTEVKR